MYGCVYPSFGDGCYGLFANLTNKTWCKKDHGLGTMRNNEIDNDIDNSWQLRYWRESNGFSRRKWVDINRAWDFLGSGLVRGGGGKRHLILSQTHLGTVNAASFVDQWRNSGGLYRRFRILPSTMMFNASSDASPTILTLTVTLW